MMSETGGAAVRPRQPRSRGGRGIRAGRRGACAPRLAGLRFRRPAISNSPGRRSARRWPRLRDARRRRDPGDSGHAVRRQPRQERPAVGDEQLHGATIPGSRCGSAAISAIDPKLLQAAADRIAAVAPAAERRAETLARRRRPRHQRPGRQFQHRQARAHAVGRAWVSAGPRRRSAASRIRGSMRRSTARRGSASAASSCSRISCSPACWSSASTRRPTPAAARFPQIEFVKAPLSARPSEGDRRLSRPRRRAARTASRR